MSQQNSTGAPSGMRPFLMRMHLYVGLLIGPFLFVAAFTGLLYVLTPQIEAALYRDALFTKSQGQARSLTDQAEAARHYLGGSLSISAVRPAPYAGETTRIQFSDPSLGESENRTIFVDPVTLGIKGDLTTYGTSGILPFRITLDYLHRNMLLGNWGRYYSELAASWLWVVVLGGVVLWVTGPARRRAVKDMPKPQRERWIHATLGVIAGVVMVFLSATGLTWSQQAGARIDALRATVGWTTPSVSLALPKVHDHAHMDHSGHSEQLGHDAHADHGMDLTAREDRASELDTVLSIAREAGIDSPYTEIRLPKPEQAWSIREYDRSWPTQVDSLAIDPNTLEVTSRADFETFGLVAKLVRWGIDAHMGVLFGIPNQIMMALAAAALMIVIVYGYMIWWQRRPRKLEPLRQSWARLPMAQKVLWGVIGAGLGWALPTLGISLMAFIVIDLLRSRLQAQTKIHQ